MDFIIWSTLCSSCSSIMIMMSWRVGWKARARLVGGNPKLFLFQVQLRRPTTILLMIAHLGKIPTLRKTSLISASICTSARAPLVKATSSHNLKKNFTVVLLFQPYESVPVKSISSPAVLLLLAGKIFFISKYFPPFLSLSSFLVQMQHWFFPIRGDFKRS